MQNVIEVYWDEKGNKDGKAGCWRAKLQGRPTLHDAGSCITDAIANLLATARSFGLPGNEAEYKIKKL
ncbi:MAG: hypothetical protein ACOZAO_03665 [Patescibacteria group bacterium]